LSRAKLHKKLKNQDTRFVHFVYLSFTFTTLIIVNVRSEERKQRKIKKVLDKVFAQWYNKVTKPIRRKKNED